MVLELLEGGSLRSMLDRGTLLTVSQAARVGRDVASALEYAHARGVLHRDIKPANLLFDEHGIVRVADFGLARALAEASWTEPAGAVFGTARYASPEQATRRAARRALRPLLARARARRERSPAASRSRPTRRSACSPRARKQPLVAPEELGPLAARDRPRRRDRARRPLSRRGARCARRSPTSATRCRRPDRSLLAGMVDRADPHPDPRRARRAPRRCSTRTRPRSCRECTQAPTANDAEPPRRRALPGERRLVPWIVAIVLIVTVGLAAAALAQVSSAKTVSIPGLRGLSIAQATQIARAAGLDVTVGTPSRARPEGHRHRAEPRRPANSRAVVT